MMAKAWARVTSQHATPRLACLAAPYSVRLSVCVAVYYVAVGDMKCVVDVQTTRLSFAIGNHWRI